ncbi:MAG: acyl carrier protein [Bacteroidales bacterium]|jgi:acyl carrier protein
MEEKVIIANLEKIFRQVFSNESLILKRGMSANDVAGWNSLNHMILVSEIEKAFSIKLKLKDLNKMHTVGDMIDIIMSKL